MQREDEIQRAHDMLRAAVMDEVPHPFDPDVLRAMHASLDALCWVLQHNHNVAFRDNLERLRKFLEVRGYQMRAVH
jgi:hypothetical protein